MNEADEQSELMQAMVHALRAPAEADGTRRRLTLAAARLGAMRAVRGGSIYDLVADLIALERKALELQVADPIAVQNITACALLAGTAAFARAAANAERKRVRDARHDLMNTVGTIQNAILLMDEEAVAESREHFLAIARRNTAAARDLVRTHLSDSAAVPLWLECAQP